jgi:hypothetical protein
MPLSSMSWTMSKPPPLCRRLVRTRGSVTMGSTVIGCSAQIFAGTLQPKIKEARYPDNNEATRALHHGMPGAELKAMR